LFKLWTLLLGGSGFDVLFQFLTEAVMVCFIGGLTGVFVGIGGGLATSAIAGWRVIFTVAPIVIAFACAFLTGIVFGYLPARKAAQLDPSKRWPETRTRNALTESRAVPACQGSVE
jgi:ABC-type antimicrobial peptide transport system permease subunit